MFYWVKVISNEIANGFRKPKVRRLGDGDIQTSYQVSPAGIDSAPPDGMVAVFAGTNKSGKPIIAGYLNKDLLAQKGETRIFSVDGDRELSTYIWLKADGTMEIGGDADNMVRFSPLKSAYDELRDDLNDLKQKWNTFASAYVPGGPSSVGLPPTAQTSPVSSASVDDAKIDEIKTL
jgi:hypothetical protein